MKDFILRTGTIIAIVALIVFGHTADNSTIVALTSFVMWMLILLTLIFSIFTLIGALFVVNNPSQLDEATKVADQVTNNSRINLGISFVAYLCAFIYVEWTAPAIVYTFAVILSLISTSLVTEHVKGLKKDLTNED